LARLKQGESKTIFTRGPSAGVRVMFFGLLSIVLMSLDHRQQHVETLRNALSLIVYPIQKLVNVPAGAVRWVSEEMANRDALQDENRRLEQELFFYRSQLRKLTILEAENRRLKTLLKSAEHLPERTIIAELISVDGDPYRHQILISKGTRHGSYIGAPVLDADGVIGQVLHAGPLTSVVVLITDPSHALPVQVDRNGLRGIVRGTGRYNELVLPYMPNNGDVEVGDLLITSGLGGRFPRGYPVGRLSRISQDPGQPFLRIAAQPTADLDRVREVLLLLAPPEAPEVSTTEASPIAADAPGQATGQP
jgi:rod shape-determining protein MreC